MTFESQSQKIETMRVNVFELFDQYWFRIPPYQRSYVWGEDQLDSLIDDLRFAFESKPNKEYFLGSIVLQKQQEQHPDLAYPFTCYDVLDGQQRLTTLFLMMAVLRDLTNEEETHSQARKAVYQKASLVANRPERLRLSFVIRDQLRHFIDELIKPDGQTADEERLKELAGHTHVSLSHMAFATLYMRKQLSAFREEAPDAFERFAVFLFQKVIVIYVASESMEDAFRMFTVLNARGIPLRNSDILKSMNLGEIKDVEKHKLYAREWEEWESYLDDEFDRFLGYIRTILKKDKARENLLKEYEALYDEGRLGKGEETLKTIRTYREHIETLLWSKEKLGLDDYALRNLISIMEIGMNATDWVPCLLLYFEKFRQERLSLFVKKLESKFAADRLLGLAHTRRLTNTLNILKAIDIATKPDEVLEHTSIFAYDRVRLEEVLNAPLYHSSHCRYIMLKIEHLKQDHTNAFQGFERISIEHVLPQKPAEGSTWRALFTSEQRAHWVHRIGNLVLLSRRKNSSLNNRDFKDKMKRYFSGSMDVYPHVKSILQYDEWTPDIIEQRQAELLQALMQEFV